VSDRQPYGKEGFMICLRTLICLTFGLTTAATSLLAQDLAHYRDFRLGSPVAVVTATSAVSPADIKVLHQHPSLIQELRWRPQRYGVAAASADPVREVLFRFYEDKLYLVEVDYDQQRIEGLTDADLVESMTGLYGPPLLASTSLYAGTGPAQPGNGRGGVVAEWADAESSVTMMRGAYQTTLRLVMTLTSVESLARGVSAEPTSPKGDEEALPRESEHQKSPTEEQRLAADTARKANKPAFRP
jgi:hypothetical protein